MPSGAKSVDTYRLTQDTAKKAGDVYLKITGAETPTDRWELSIPPNATSGI